VGVHEGQRLPDIDGDFARHEVTGIIANDADFDRAGGNLSSYRRDIFVAIITVIMMVIASAPTATPPASTTA
jgi:hypothetical protein